MGVTKLCVFLVTIGAVTCFGFKGAGVETPQDQETVDPIQRLYEIFGRFVCWNDSCGGHEVPVTERNYDTTISPDYEPQIPDTETVNSNDTYPELCESLVKLIRDMEAADPSNTQLKATAFLKMLFYTMSFKAAEDERCHPAVKMLDIIILAAHKVRLEYTSDEEDCCTFMEVPMPENEYTSTELPTTETPKTCPSYTSTVQPSTEVSTDCVPPESVTKAPLSPCLEDSKTTQDPSKVNCTRSPAVTTETTRITGTSVPCPDDASKKPNSGPLDGDYGTTEDIIAEEEDRSSPIWTGSLRAIPGEHFPNYTDIPITSFSCSDKEHIPGFYADLETGCQVFHVCYDYRRESFLCPIGTIFNQPILACDYWYSSNCSLAPVYYGVNAKTVKEAEKAVDELVLTLYEKNQTSVISETTVETSFEETLKDIIKFLPVKVRVVESAPREEVTTPDSPKKETKSIVPPKKHEVKPLKYKEKVTLQKSEVGDIDDVASKIFDQILTSATHSVSKTRLAIGKIPEPVMSEADGKKMVKPKLEVPLSGSKVLPIVKGKAKLATKAKLAVPFAAKAKLAAVPVIKTAAVAPVIAKAKIAVPAAAKGKAIAAIPVAKAAAVKAAVPVSVKKLAATMPKVAAVKSKILASSVPLAKYAVLKSVAGSKAKFTPAFKAKLKLGSAPVVKGKLLAKSKLVGSVPLMKTKLVKAAAISPLTKKALAVGYMKLLKAKKLAMMG